MEPKILYTQTDEAPALATYAFFPVIEAFSRVAGVSVESKDISLAARILAQFPECWKDGEEVPDALAELGQKVREPDANIIKLPNISASVPQLTEAIRELQGQGYPLPDYPEEPATDEAKATRARYDHVKGSAVNPVLREGNSDRRAPKPVKAYARKHPHRMGAWSADSQSHVSSMERGDFYGSERSATLDEGGALRIEHVDVSGNVSALKERVAVEPGEVADAARMRRADLRAFFDDQIADAKKRGVLLSLHLKATMMKVSDPIIFGHAVRAYFRDVFERHGATLERLGADPDNGLGDVEEKIRQLSEDERSAVEADLQACYERGPSLAMVDSHAGISNLHVPSDVIIDASMPAAIRSSGQMWGPDDRMHDMKAMIPDRSYAGVYQATIDFCKEHGAFDPATMGSVPNVGLMARKAEEYGSHDKTFEIPSDGRVRVLKENGDVLVEHGVEAGDIWRMCQTKDDAIRDWVKLAVNRARETGAPAIFWLDSERAHDAELIAKVERYLPEHDTDGLDLRIMSPVEATRVTLERAKAGEDTISVTGNVLRDYLTDLFPILEVGTSAKMLSIVPLMRGGGLFETGAGGSAPKHVQQFEQEGHLRWDSLGEFMALSASLEHLAKTFDNERARVLGATLEDASTRYLEENRGPSRKVGELDNRGSQFYLVRYWARALADQERDAELSERFKPIADDLEGQEDAILEELNAAQGDPVDLGGSYWIDGDKARSAMRPSERFNAILGRL